jgi:GTP-binding protein HflX
VVGPGKLRELADHTGGSGVVSRGPAKPRRRGEDAGERDEGDVGAEAAEAVPSEPTSAPGPRATVVLVDHDITPSQARNLERATGAEVLDRTAVILAIFRRHARTREAKLQVEIARLAYLAPRLRESGVGKDRQSGGVGGRGAGESYVELDRRKLRDRVAELRRELVSLERETRTRRRRRAEHPTVALVGYTNAGKSSLMRALTGSEILVADQLFATLGTTVRALQPESVPRILVSDTVGFIKKLPHDLVASFRSTLEEAREASLLLQVVDASDPAFPAQIEVTRRVLHELEADESPRRLLFNKVDKVDAAARARLAAQYPDAMQISAKCPEDVARLREAIVAFFEKDAVEAELVVPYAKQRLVGEIHASCRVTSERYEADGAHLHVRALPDVLARLREEL